MVRSSTTEVTHRRGRRLLAVAVLSVVAVLAGLVPAPSANAQATALRIDGRGFGHGRGMGQYGAFGYAVDQGWDYRRILAHYYGDTVEGNIGAALMTVRLSMLNANGLPAGTDYPETIVSLRSGAPQVFTADGAPLAVAGNAVRVARSGVNQFIVLDGPSCSGPWTERHRVSTSVVRILPRVRTDDVNDLLAVCQGANDARWVQGDVNATETGDRQITVNQIAMEEYLRGVVPRESPASWGDAGGGKGMHALRAQAVAARSYSAAEDRPGPGKTCDTISCQVYVGRFTRVGGVERSGVDPRTDRAIGETAGQVRMRGGAVQRTEFSSSTGGHTAGGTFPAVPDAGDATASNPNHRWTVELLTTTIEAHYQRGTLQSAQVLARDGVGPDGGRATMVRLGFSGGTVDVAAIDFRRAFGLKSEWFYLQLGPPAPPPAPPPPARSIAPACTGAPAAGFTDVERPSTHAASIDCVAALGVTVGSAGGGRFVPDGIVSRGQMASFIDRLLARSDRPLPRGAARFDDVEGTTHAGSINALAAAGIAQGRPDGDFDPGQAVSRAQMATFLVRAAEHVTGVPLPPAAADYFSDDTDPVHGPAIGKAAEAGLTAGSSPGRYSPSAANPRDQMATFLARLAALLTEAGRFDPV